MFILEFLLFKLQTKAIVSMIRPCCQASATVTRIGLDLTASFHVSMEPTTETVSAHATVLVTLVSSHLL